MVKTGSWVSIPVITRVAADKGVVGEISVDVVMREGGLLVMDGAVVLCMPGVDCIEQDEITNVKIIGNRFLIFIRQTLSVSLN